MSVAALLSAVALLSQAPADAVLFDGATKAAWKDESAADDRVREIPSPTTAPSPQLRFLARKTDVAPLTPTNRPRAQLVSATNVMRRGGVYWQSVKLRIPTNFPRLRRNETALLVTPAYGPPYKGSPPLGLRVLGDDLVIKTNKYGRPRSQEIWDMRIRRGEWIRFTWRFRLAKDGWTEMYVDGRKATFRVDGRRTKRPRLALIDRTNGKGPWSARLSVYFDGDIQRDHLSTAFAGFRIATTRAAAEGG
jgi:hypothetical protein